MILLFLLDALKIGRDFRSRVNLISKLKERIKEMLIWSRLLNMLKTILQPFSIGDLILTIITF
jgi:hypothetical protein